MVLLSVSCHHRSSAGKVVESSVGILADYAQQLMESVFSSVGQCPPLLRMALRQLWARVAERFTGPRKHSEAAAVIVIVYIDKA